MRALHFTVAAILVLMAGAGPAYAQSVDGPANFRVFLKGSAIGGEDVVVKRTDAGVTITSNGRLAAPLDLVTRQCVVRYDASWRPIDLTVDAIARGAAMAIKTTFANGQASSEITTAGAPTTKTDLVAADTLVLPNLFFGAYEALALRLASIPDGSSFKAYIAPQAEIIVKQTARSTQKIETAKRVIDVRTYALTFQNPGAPLDAVVWTDESGRLLRFEVAAQSLIFVREDLASVATRGAGRQPRGRRVGAHPGQRVHPGRHPQPAVGRSARRGQGPLPAVVLVGGSGPTERDETVAGIPIFGLLASPLADAGYFVLRYDKRGVGQSGGRAEAGTVAGIRRRRARGAALPPQAQGRRSEADCPVRPQRRRAWCRCSPRAATKTIAAVVLARIAIGYRRRTRARAAAVSAREDEPARGRARVPHRSAEADPGRSSRAGRLGRHPANR